jgi:hypothetical protein
LSVPGCSGTITIRGDERDAVRSIEHAYKAAAATHPADEDLVEHVGGPEKKKQLVSQERVAAKKAAKDVPKPPPPKKTAPEKTVAAEPLAEPLAGSTRKQQFTQERAKTKTVPLDASGSGATVTIGGSLNPK